MKKILPFIILLFVIVVSVVVVSQYKTKSFTVIVAGDTFGKYAAIGNSIAFGAEESSKKTSQLPHDFSLKITRSPDQGNDYMSEAVALKAVSDPSVIAVIGHSSSGNTAAALKVYRAYKMPILMPVATRPDLTAEPNGPRNVYRLVPKDNLQASTIASFCAQKLQKFRANHFNNSKNSTVPSFRVAVISDRSPYGESLSQSLREALSNAGITSSIKLSKFRDKDNWSDMIREDGSNIVIFAGYYKEGGELINEIRTAGLKQTIILTDGCFPSDIFKIIKVDPGEIYISFIAKDWSSNKLAIPLVEEANRKSNIDVSFAPFAYDSFQIIYEAVNKILSQNQDNINLDRRKLLDYLIQNRGYSGNNYIAGPYNFEDSGDNISGEHYIYKIKISKNKNKFNNLTWEMVK
jgi:branched-chain amino acid transport system substrate-binding protein